MHVHVHVHVAEHEWYVKGRRAQRKTGGLQEKKREEKEMQKKRSTGPSRVVPHRSTTPARTCLTSLFGREAVSQADMAALHRQPMSIDFNIPSSDPPVPLAVPFVWGP